MKLLTFLLIGTFIFMLSSSVYAMGTRFDHLYEAELATGIYFEEAPFETVPRCTDIYAEDGMIAIVYRNADGEEITARKYLGPHDIPDGEQRPVYCNGHTVTLISAPGDDDCFAAAWSTDSGSYLLTSDRPVPAERMLETAAEMIR
ncbi:MAG: hypothetical protein ILP19_01545 [Oscillospiraceae bacterium]|nr:hypothetical protein [Oscillospiraceae bacterium]